MALVPLRSGLQAFRPGGVGVHFGPWPLRPMRLALSDEMLRSATPVFASALNLPGPSTDPECVSRQLQRLRCRARSGPTHASLYSAADEILPAATLLDLQ